MFCRARTTDASTITGDQNAIEAAIAPFIQLWRPALLAPVPVMLAAGSLRQMDVRSNTEMRQQQIGLNDVWLAFVLKAN